MQQILFIQGGGAGVHDEWDSKLVESLGRELGDGYEIRYPPMPQEDNPHYGSWADAIRSEIAELGDRAVLVGHSIGGTILINALAEQPPQRALAAIILVSAPFVGKGGWPSNEIKEKPNLGARLPANVPIHLFYGSNDETAPFVHADLYTRTIRQAQVHRLPGRDHQLGDDLSEIADVITSLE